MPDHPVWRDYRARRGSLIGVTIVGILVVLLVLEFTDSAQIRQLAFLIDAIFVFVFFMRFSCWRCPRCGKSFHTGAYSVPHYNRKCLHCGLPMYSTDFKRRA